MIRLLMLLALAQGDPAPWLAPSLALSGTSSPAAGGGKAFASLLSAGRPTVEPARVQAPSPADDAGLIEPPPSLKPSPRPEPAPASPPAAVLRYVEASPSWHWCVSGWVYGRTASDGLVYPDPLPAVSAPPQRTASYKRVCTGRGCQLILTYD